MWPLLKKLYKGREVFKWLLMSINALMRNNLKRVIGKSIARSIYNSQRGLSKFDAEYDKRNPFEIIVLRAKTSSVQCTNWIA